jgi:hypothetical protein
MRRRQPQWYQQSPHNFFDPTILTAPFTSSFLPPICVCECRKANGACTHSPAASFLSPLCPSFCPPLPLSDCLSLSGTCSRLRRFNSAASASLASSLSFSFDTCWSGRSQDCCRLPPAAISCIRASSSCFFFARISEQGELEPSSAHTVIQTTASTLPRKRDFHEAYPIKSHQTYSMKSNGRGFVARSEWFTSGTQALPCGCEVGLLYEACVLSFSGRTGDDRVGGVVEGKEGLERVRVIALAPLASSVLLQV